MTSPENKSGPAQKRSWFRSATALWTYAAVAAGASATFFTSINNIVETATTIESWVGYLPKKPGVPADVIVCLNNTFYRAHAGPVQGDPSPMDLVFWYQLLNKGSAQATVTFINITVYGQHIKTRQTIPTNLDYNTSMQIHGKTLTRLMENAVYIGPGTEVRPYMYAESKVTWADGHSQMFTHSLKVR